MTEQTKHQDPAEAALAAEFGRYLRHLAQDFTVPLQERIKHHEQELVAQTDTAVLRLVSASYEVEKTVGGLIRSLDSLQDSVSAQGVEVRRLRRVVVLLMSIFAIVGGAVIATFAKMH